MSVLGTFDSLIGQFDFDGAFWIIHGLIAVEGPSIPFFLLQMGNYCNIFPL